MIKPDAARFRANAILTLASAFVSIFTTPAAAAPGAVYTMTNSAAGNAVVMFLRAADGTLGAPQSFPTGGLGSGAGLGSQGALALSEGGRWLLAVNAGSNDVTVFSVSDTGLAMTDRHASGGAMPISVALHNDLVYVLNAGGTANLSGFRLTPAGQLVPIRGGTQVLPGAAPAQVSFAVHGAALVVTHKASNSLTLYAVDGAALSGPFTYASAGATPFGFGLSRTDVLVVSEAAASTVSSYEVDDAGHLRVITPALATGQSAACWVVVTQNGKYAYVANAGSASISSVAVARDGALSLLAAAAAHTPPGTHPIDLAVSGNSQYLFSLASGTVSAFHIAADGSLTPVQVASGLPPSSAGLVAR